MRIVLDTSALYYPETLEALQDEGHTLVLPAVVLVERARQLTARGLDGVTEMLHFAEGSGSQLEPFGALEALRSAQRAPLDPAAWKRHARDALVAGHLGEDDVLCTANVRDFRSLGVPLAQILDPARRGNQP